MSSAHTSGFFPRIIQIIQIFLGFWDWHDKFTEKNIDNCSIILNFDTTELGDYSVQDVIINAELIDIYPRLFRCRNHIITKHRGYY